MPAKRKAASPKEASTATIGFEAKLWLAADKLRNNMDAAEPSGARQPARQGSPKGQRGGAEQYKHVVLGLIFLKYISDTFDARPGLDKHRLGELIDLIGTIALVSPSPQPSPSGRGSQEPHYRGGYDFPGLVERARKRTLLLSSRALATLRDTLLPKLLSGELSPKSYV